LKTIDHLKKLQINRTFVKFFVSYLVIVFICMSLLSSVMYVQFSKSSLEEIQLNLREMLDQTSEHMSFVREYTYALGLQTLRDTEVMNIIYSDEVPEIKKYLASLKITNIINSNPIIDSIYLYNAKTGEIQYNLSRSAPLFQDPEIISYMSNNQSNRNLQFIPRYIIVNKPGGGQDKVSVISVIFTDTAGQTNNAYAKTPEKPRLDGALVINLKAEYLQKSIASAVKNNESYMAILDRDSNVISDSNLQNFGKNIAHEAALSGILTSDREWGYFVRNLEGHKTVVTYLRPQSGPWVIVNVSSYQSLFQKSNALIVTISTLCVIIFFVGVLLSLLAARNAYVPFSKLAKSLEHLKLSLRSSIHVLKKEYLKRILEGRTVLDSGIDSKMLELNIDLPSRGVAVMLFGIDGYDSFVKTRDRSAQNAVKSSLADLIRTRLSGFRFEPVDFDDDLYCVIIGTEEESTFVACAQSAAADIQQAVKENLDISISVGIGQAVGSLEDAYLSYSNSLELLRQYRFVYGHNSILHNGIIELKRKKEFSFIDKNKKRLTEALKLSDLKQVEVELGEMIEEVSAYPYNYIMLIFNQLTLDALQSVEALIETDVGELDFNTVYMELNRLDTLAELKIWFLEFCVKINILIENKKANRNTDMIQRILDYLSENCFRNDLGIEQLAQKVNLTPGYFGKLFRENMGKTVNEYVLDLRMRRSMELLETTVFPIHEISESVGFANPAYFTTSFKKYFGLTPNQYRIETRNKREFPVDD